MESSVHTVVCIVKPTAEACLTREGLVRLRTFVADRNQSIIVDQATAKQLYSVLGTLLTHLPRKPKR